MKLEVLKQSTFDVIKRNGRIVLATMHEQELPPSPRNEIWTNIDYETFKQDENQLIQVIRHGRCYYAGPEETKKDMGLASLTTSQHDSASSAAASSPPAAATPPGLALCGGALCGAALLASLCFSTTAEGRKQILEILECVKDIQSGLTTIKSITEWWA
ncbi:unnamed protein product [Cuscuta epithymum]|uniref:Uncharacterized protein n=1 Tax=Cuscuta epithymum TaxID=186058 RepID=A0AAV0CZ07_9ASTE|nr:unnamed protein product [Cuscuta epithymum]CAH9085685.1 unnamed protein product [Cuscuta epithymum]